MGPVRPRMTRKQSFQAIAAGLAHRLDALAWLHARGIAWVTVGTAARVLGVTTQRVGRLIRDGRLRAVEGLPGGSRLDRYVRVSDLAGAPTPMEAGHARDWNIEARRTRRAAERGTVLVENPDSAEYVGPGRNGPNGRPANYGRWGGRKLFSEQSLRKDR